MTPWPATIWVVRHGESAGNVALAAAEAAGHPTIAIAARDADVPLSDTGEHQASALGRWFAQMPKERRPTAILSSPYLRAQRTAEIVAETAGLSLAPRDYAIDERLREKEFGVFDRLTKHGIAQRHPEQAELRRAVGKFYYRPPGGESWCDVVLRLRSVLDMLARDYADERVLLVGHQVIVSCLRYSLERMNEAELLSSERESPIANCAITQYDFPAVLARNQAVKPTLLNFVAPLKAEGEPITTEPDAPVAPK